MLMTQREFDSLVNQINQAFQSHFDRLETLEEKVEALINEQKKGSKAGASRRKQAQSTILSVKEGP